MKNFKHPYEKHLAEKLVQHPPPDDPDQNWQHMKTLLDNDMPRGGGGPMGSRRWWAAGVLVLTVAVGTWFGSKTLLNKGQGANSVAGTIKSVNGNNNPSVASTDKNEQTAGTSNTPGRNTPDANGDNNANSTRLPVVAHASTTNRPVINEQEAACTDNDASAANNAQQHNDVAATPAAKARSSGVANDDASSLATSANSSKATETSTSYHNKTSVDRNKLYTSTTKNNKHTARNNRVTPIGNRTMLNGDDGGTDANTIARTTAANKGKNNRVKNGGTSRARNNATRQGGKNDGNNNALAYKPRITLPSEPTTGSALKELPVTYNVNYTGGLVVSPSGVLKREFTYYLQAPEKETTVNKKSSRRKPWHRSPIDDDDKRFSAGLSLPLGFPIGDQQAFGYNRNAGVNAISDYIPSPHFQYHFSNRTYVQAGVQFSQPQFVRPFLLYQDHKFVQQGPNMMEQVTSIAARKLYYFNLPLTVYHSPLRNFYMGTGLQYSSLLSGVAQYQKTERRVSAMGLPPQEYVIKNYFTKFKNDSLSGRLNGNEVRLLVDMSYYWSRFTVGLQYSQAFNNYVSFQVTPSSPYIFDKNKSLQFYLRYNFWEDKKRKQPKGETLSLK